MTTGIDSQILASFEQGLNPEQIADEFGFEVRHVKAKLMSLSANYRKACGAESPEEDELNFTREEQLMIKRELFSLAMSTDDEHLKGKLLLNLRDDGKGRKDVVKKMGDNNFNILQLVNGSLQQANRAVDMLTRKKAIEA